jgi:uncharacterized protein
MSTDPNFQPEDVRPIRPAPAAPPATATGMAWGNSAPLALAGFGVTAFMLAMIYINAVPVTTTPVVFGVALMFGGLAQFVAGVIQLRIGNAFGGMLFCGFGAFWLSLWAFAEFFLRSVPVTQVGHAEGLFLYAFGIFAAIMFLASFRTSMVVVTALGLLTATLFVIGAALYTAPPAVIAGITHSGLLQTGGWMAIVLAGFALYLALGEVCEATYGREILPVGHLEKPRHEALREA